MRYQATVYLALTLALSLIGSALQGQTGVRPGSARRQIGVERGSDHAQSLAPAGLPVTYERLLNAAKEPGNWLMYGGDYRGHHYSTLTQITVGNVRRLRAKWIWRLVAYVQQLGRQGITEVSAGDATLGAVVYQKNGCAACHTVAGAGGLVGPELTDIGSRRALRHLRQSIVDPSADIALDFRPVSIIDRRGHTVSGIHLNEDEHSVHLRDVNGNLRSFMKGELTRMTLPRVSLMPPFAALPPVDLENLVAYLGSLRSSGDLAAGTEVWTFDRLENIGGHKTTILGQPVLIDTPGGRSVLFDGVDDALFVDNHPLAGAATFTWEAIFRPDGGQTEQRWFHLSELDPVTGLDTDNRMLFEIRVTGDKWFFDSYNQSGSASKALMNRTSLHPLGVWYHVASVYDGTQFSNYVDGVREGGAELHLAPHGPGHASVGVRINKVFYFKGAVHLARFTRRALSPSEFLRAPRKP